MPITYTNAKGQTYYLHQGRTQTGEPASYFSMKPEGPLAGSILKHSKCTKIPILESSCL